MECPAISLTSGSGSPAWASSETKRSLKRCAVKWRVPAVLAGWRSRVGCNQKRAATRCDRYLTVSLLVNLAAPTRLPPDDDRVGPLALGGPCRDLGVDPHAHRPAPRDCAEPEDDPAPASPEAMRFGQDMTQSEIGERLGVSQAHIHRLLKAAEDRLRELLDAP